MLVSGPRLRFPLRVGSLALVAVAAAAGCDPSSSDVVVDEMRSQRAHDGSPAVAQADRQALAEGNAAFAMALYRQVQSNSANVVFSPASISTALAMTFAGARGETETQMATALRFTLPQARLHPAMNQLSGALAGRAEDTDGADGTPARLGIVNATWAQKGFVMQPSFLDVLAVSYGAGVNLLDFIHATEPARQTINRWVEMQTEDRIKDLIPQGALDASTRLLITNAVYFNSAWKTPLTEGTADGPFTRLDGSTVTVPIMNGNLAAPAAELPGMVAVALPYQDTRLSMLIVLPDAGKLSEVESTLASQGLGPITAALAEKTIILSMPRFELDTPIDLKASLSALGMPAAFSASADFTGIADGGLYLQAVLHKAFIAVAEKGTEAAAATGVLIGRQAVPVGLHVVVDRPFLFFLRDEPTGAILFLGRVADPSR